MDNSASWELNSSNYHLAHAFHDEKHVCLSNALVGIEVRDTRSTLLIDQKQTTERGNKVRPV